MRRVVLIAVAMLALTAQAAHAAQGMEVAVQDDPVFLTQAYYDRERALQTAHDMGATRIRANMIWANVVNAPKDPTQPSPIAYNWAPYDSLIDAAARYGIRVQLTVTGAAPAWATSDRKSGVYGPKASSFGDFTRAVATHFKGRVDRYSIWNEPNYVSWMQPFDKAPALYRELYQAAYKQIKRTDKNALVLMGETSPYAIRKRAIAPLQFLRDVTCATGGKAGGDTGTGALDPGVDPNDTTTARAARVRAAAAKVKPPKLVRGPCKPLKADGFAHHPYDYRHKPDYAYKGSDNATLGSLSRLTGTLQSLAKIGALRLPKGSKPPPVYLTEYGYFQSGKYALAETARSAYLKKAYTMAQRDKSVVQMLQFSLITPPVNFPGGYFDLSLVHLDGAPTPGYEALRGWAATAGKRGQIKLPGGAITLPPAPAGKRRGR